jgi:hypothetical protein
MLLVFSNGTCKGVHGVLSICGRLTSLHARVVFNSRPQQSAHQALRYPRPDAKVQVRPVRSPQQTGIGGLLDVGDLRAHQGQLEGEKTCETSQEAARPRVARHGDVRRLKLAGVVGEMCPTGHALRLLRSCCASDWRGSALRLRAGGIPDSYLNMLALDLVIERCQ